MLLWLIFLTLASHADSIETFCFEDSLNKSAAIKSLEPLLLPADKVSFEESCFTLVTADHRRELLQRFIRNRHPEATVSFSSEELRKEACRLKVEKTRIDQDSNSSIGLRGAGVTERKSRGMETSKIQTINDFELAVNQNIIQGSCRFITPERYEIKLTVRKDLKPLHPPVSPGVIVIVNGRPPDQETSQLSTTVQLQKGERVQIGTMNQKRKNEGKDLGLPPRAQVKNLETSSSEEIYLSID